MTVTEKKGQKIVLTHIALVLLLELALAGQLVLQRGIEESLPRMSTVIVMAALCFWLYQGSQLAQWIIAILLILGGGIALMLPPDPDLVIFLWTLGRGVLLIVLAGVLILSRPVSAFLAYRRGDKNLLPPGKL